MIPPKISLDCGKSEPKHSEIVSFVLSFPYIYKYKYCIYNWVVVWNHGIL